MDKQDMAMKKGIVLTMDALFALALLLITATMMLVFISRPSSFQLSGTDAASGMMASLKTLTMEDLNDNPRYPYANAVIRSNSTSSFNRTVLETIADLYMAGNTTGAGNLSLEMLNAPIPRDYGVDLLIEKQGTDCQNVTSNFSCIYSSSRGAARNYVSVGRHFIYSNSTVREMRLVIYK